MYCAYCGSRLNGTERFCSKCGNSTAAFAEPAFTSETAAHYLNAHTCTTPTPASWTQGPSRMAIHQAEANRYRMSLKNCTIAGIILAVMTFGGVAGLLSAGTPGMALTCASIASAFFAPFGFAPMLHWIRTHDFFIILNGIILLCALLLAFTIAVIAGPIYIYHAISKIKENERLATLS